MLLHNIKNYAFSILLLLLAVSVEAMDINAGKDRVECPGLKIKLGGDASRPTAGPEPLENYIFEWYSVPAGFQSSEANPEISTPDVRTTYFVRVTDADGFTCQGKVTITPVIIKSITFKPESIPADGIATTKATAQTDASDRVFKWSIPEDGGTGCTIDATTAVVKAGKTPGSIKVKVQDKQAEENNLQSCALEATLCVGDPEKCCPDISGDMEFGPVAVKLPKPIKATGATDKEGYCTYMTEVATISIETPWKNFSIPAKYNLTGVNISWKQKMNGEEKVYKDVKIVWKGSEQAKSFLPLEVYLTQLSIGVDLEGKISGGITFSVMHNSDTKIGGIALIKKGVHGDFTYKFSSGKTFEGTFDFGGIKDFNVALMKNTTLIGEGSASINGEGELNIKLKGIDGAKFSSHGLELVVKELFWDVTYNLADPELTFNKGNALLEVTELSKSKEVKPNNISVSVDMDGHKATGTASGKDITAFGHVLNGKLKVVVDYEFNLHSIEGEDIVAKHPDFDQSVKVKEFKIEEGKLVSFNFSGQVKYKNGIFFEIENVAYNEPDKSLQVSAIVVIGNKIVGKVINFAVKGEEGKISIERIYFDFKQSPIYIHADLKFADSSFTGTYKGRFGEAEIAGKMAIGAKDQFNYAFIHLGLGINKGGIPMGPIFRLNSIGGLAGYNYDFKKEKPAQGLYVLGAYLSISDVRKIVSLSGDVVMVLGEQNSFFIRGKLASPAKGNPILSGLLEVDYNLSSSTIEGKTNATIKVPADSGNYFTLTSGDIKFSMNETEWSIDGPDMSGNIFKIITVKGTLSVKSPLNDLSKIDGKLNGSISYDKKLSFIYPESFDPSTCASADETDSFGFGVKGDLNVSFSGNLDVKVNSEGFVGKISSTLNGDASGSIKWPCLSCGDDCVYSQSAVVSGKVELSREAGVNKASGVFTFKGKDGEEEKKNMEIEF